MILVTQGYDPGTDDRRRELARCRRLNESSPLLDEVEYLDGINRVLTFGELVSHCSDKHRGKPCVIANTDIAFHESYGLRSFVKEGRLVSLTRWDSPSGPRFIGHQHEDAYFSGSQDCWAFIAGDLPDVDLEIPMGTVGCDNVIAGWAASSGVQVVNPALCVRTFHIHRDVDRPDRPVLAGFYAYPQITAASVTSAVLCHHWPSRDGKLEIVWEHDLCQPSA